MSELDSLNHRYDHELAEIQGAGEDEEGTKNDSYWVSMARSAFESSGDYLDANIRDKWEESISHQNNEHASGSKYHTDAYRLRSKTFRPKTRTNNLTAEATFARAVFATNDLVSITPINDNDEAQEASSQINQSLLQYRLSNSIPWFLTVMGAYQDARVYGVCASYQSWSYETVMTDGIEEVIEDKPTVELIAPENIRFSPSADWRDPIKSSPYVIRMVPMFAGEAKEWADNRGYKEYSLSEYVTSAREGDDDSTRKERQGSARIDPAEQESEVGKEFEMVWLHENFIRVDGEDVVYWTLGTRHLLSKPEPVNKYYPHLSRMERPVILGITVLESHKTYPASPTNLISNLQVDANEIANQRFDNVKLVLNKRYFVRNGASGIDLAALARNVPGGSVKMEDPTKDVHVVDTNDITGSSYQEQDRLDLQIDELSGTFSQQTVQNNRNLNETVGGMNLMSEGADVISEYSFRVFIETWLEPVLKQLVRMEQFYETDEVILAIAAEEAEIYQKFGADEVTDELLMSDLTVNVNVGFGNTNPQQKLERFQYALQAVASLPGIIERLDIDEVTKEIFGKSGYRDGARFFKPAEEMEQQQPQPDPATQAAMARLEVEQAKLEHQKQKDMAELQLREKIEMSKLAAAQDMKLKDLYEKLGLEREKLATTRQVEGSKINLQRTQQALQSYNLKQGYDTF